MRGKGIPQVHKYLLNISTCPRRRQNFFQLGTVEYFARGVKLVRLWFSQVMVEDSPRMATRIYIYTYPLNYFLRIIYHRQRRATKNFGDMPPTTSHHLVLVLVVYHFYFGWFGHCTAQSSRVCIRIAIDDAPALAVWLERMYNRCLWKSEGEFSQAYSPVSLQGCWR